MANTKLLKEGMIFNDLTIISSYIRKSVTGAYIHSCRCTCGKIVEVRGADLKNGKQKSCGCHKNKLAAERFRTHNKSKTKEYFIFYGIKSRCYNPNNVDYPAYGGRGITICERWLESFENFLEDMGTRPTEKHQIDRIDVNGNYCKENCRWVTNFINCMNKRKTVTIYYLDIELPLIYWCDLLNLPVDTIRYRYKAGWNTWDIFNIPIQKHNKGIRNG